MKKLSELGMENVEIVFEKDLSKKIFSGNSSVFTSSRQQSIVREKLLDIGYQIQRSSKLLSDGRYKERWDESRIHDAALGYNDAQQMVVFEFNVPTYTLTPFWQNGIYKNHSWKGLFQRTDK